MSTAPLAVGRAALEALPVVGAVEVTAGSQPQRAGAAAFEQYPHENTVPRCRWQGLCGWNVLFLSNVCIQLFGAPGEHLWPGLCL